MLGPMVEHSPIPVDTDRLEELIAKVDALTTAVHNIKRGGFSIPLALVNSFSVIELSAVSLEALVRMSKVDVRAVNTTLQDIHQRAKKGRSQVTGRLAEAWLAMTRTASAATKKAAQLVERYRVNTPEEDAASEKVRRLIVAGRTPPRHLREKVRELMFGDMPTTVEGRYKPDPLKSLRLVAMCPKLQALIIVGCPLSDLSPLRALQRLTFIDFSGTQVADPTPLKECKALREAFFKGTPAANRDEANTLIAAHTFHWASVLEEIVDWQSPRVLRGRVALPAPKKQAS
jgi:hypothetical protein